MKRALEYAAALGALALGVLSALETIAGAGATIIVLGELVHLWDLL